MPIGVLSSYTYAKIREKNLKKQEKSLGKPLWSLKMFENQLPLLRGKQLV